VLKDSLLDRGGVKEGDMLYEIGGHKIDNFGEAHVPWSSDKVRISDIISRYKFGDTIHLLLYRADKKIDLNISLSGAAIYPIRLIYPEYEHVDYEMIGGFIVMDLNRNLINELASHNESLSVYKEPRKMIDAQVVITYVFPGSKINQFDVLSSGDIVSRINGISVSTVEQYREAVLKSIHTGLFIVETSDKKCTVMPLETIVRDELRLSRSYDYKMTSSAEQLVRHYEQKIKG
jgi:C-terminal processing protease CtpA/Prc